MSGAPAHRRVPRSVASGTRQLSCQFDTDTLTESQLPDSARVSLENCASSFPTCHAYTPRRLMHVFTLLFTTRAEQQQLLTQSGDHYR